MTNATLRTKLLVGASLSAMLLTGVAAQAQSEGGWSRGRGAGADPAATAARVAQDQALRQNETNSATQRALDAFRRAAQTRTQMQDAQVQARIAAQQAINTIPNGIGQGGLQAAPEIEIDPSLWVGAGGPQQSAGKDGRTNVTVDQTQQKAILTWDSFNVGRETDLTFNQQGADWVVLNRVRDADASQIHGSINAKGTVLILNQNGILFGGASTINVRNLVASSANITNDDFLNRGIYSQIAAGNYMPSFTGAGGSITVEAGAQIKTHAPTSVTSGGGYVLLMGTDVTNEGSIATPRGQTLLSAGDNFLVRRGYGTEENTYSTTRGNEVRGLITAGSTSGTVTNSGLIEATQGDITLAGRTIRQDGVLVSTTSVNQRGTIHLLNSTGDGEGSVTLGKDSLTIILPELSAKDTALDSQRDALVKASTGIALDPALGFNDRSTLADRLDQSRIEIVTGGNVTFEGGSQTSAQGGQVAVQANAGRITVEKDARIDVSGVMGVALDMESNSIVVNVQGNEMRDSPQNRDNDRLRSTDVWIDVRDLILVPDGTGGYEGDRWYTGGGLLEVGGQLANMARGIGEWTAVGGTITLAAKEVVAEKGAVFDLSGGSLDYAAGWVNSTRVLGEDGKLYDIGQAPAGMKMVAWGDAYVRKHERWGEAYTQVWSHPLGGARASRRWSDGYSVGRDAGRLILSAPTVLFEGDIVSEVVNGDRQTIARADGVTDGYKLGQHTAAKAGTLVLGEYNFLGLAELYNTDIRISDLADSGVAIGGDGMIAEDRVNTAWFDAAHLTTMGLGGLQLGSRGKITIDAPLEMATGGSISLIAPIVDIAADITARGGSISATNRFTPVAAPGQTSITRELKIDGKAGVILREGTTLDLRGLWVNASDSGPNLSNLAWLNGGNVTLESSLDVTIEKGSLIDVSSGGAILVDGSARGGRGGSVSLLANRYQGNSANNGMLTLDGDIRAYGVEGGGTLRLESGPAIIIGGKGLATDGVLGADETAPADLVTLEDYLVKAGEAMPVDYSFTVRVALPGEVVAGPPQFSVLNPVLLLADWQIPAYPNLNNISLRVTYFRPDGTTAIAVRSNPNGPGPIIPAGSRIIGFSEAFSGRNNLPPGYVVPEGVFQGGIPIQPFLRTITAGTIVGSDTTLPKGFVLPFGANLPRSVSVGAPTIIGERFLNTGFSAYEVNGEHGVVVAKNAAIDVTMPVYRLNVNARQVISDSDPKDALELWTPPLYLENPVSGKLTQRGGASLALQSGGWHAGGTIAISEGATVSVDPGQTIRLDGWMGRTIVDGTLNAWGGEIAITQDYRSLIGDRDRATANNRYNVNSIWIGENAVLDVAARAATATDSQGRTYGIVRDGGTISIGGAYDWEKTGATIASDAFVVIRSGALLDASGTHAVLDYPTAGASNGSRSIDVASNGGTIMLGSTRGIFIDGTMKATAGGKGAAGGTLAIALETPLYSDVGYDSAVMKVRELVLSQTGGSGLAADLRPGQGDPALIYGSGRIGVDQIEAGGFGTASLLVNGVLGFDGDVTLAMPESLRFHAGVYALTDEADAASRVSLSAPYVLLAGNNSSLGGDTFAVPAVRSSNAQISSRPSEATFAVAGNLIDIRDQIGFGVRQTAGLANGNLAVDRRGFGHVELASAGDLRLLRPGVPSTQTQSTRLTTVGDISLIAAQIYPVTGASAAITAGVTDWAGGRDINAVLRIARTPGTDASTPLSVFGTLGLNAPTIEQGGVVRAPLGQLGFSGTKTIFLPGSETSISAAGVVLPYGGTVDGIKYFYDGREVLLKDASGLNQTVVYQGINLSGQEIDVQEGALLDLSGGGDLLGGAFISGRGGSVDVLRTAFANVNPGYTFSDPDNEVYAIVPGHAGYAPSAPDAGSGDPAIGRQITVPAGVPGLPAGTYTLMPSTYALMPGAFRVEIGKTSPTLSKVNSIDGLTYSAPATLSTLGTSQRNVLPNAVFITSSKDVRRYSGYGETSYNDFVLADAARRGVLRAPLTSDAQFLRLTFGENAGRTGRPALIFDGKALFAPETDSKGFTGGVTVAMDTKRFFEASELELLAPGTVPALTPDAPGASIHADALTAIGAPSLTINAGSAKLILRSGATLSAAEVALTATQLLNGLPGGGIVIEQGATIDTIGKGKVSRGADDGYLTEISTGLILSNGRLNVRLTGTDGPAISIGACPSGDCAGETRLVSEGSMALATTGNFTIADNVRYGTRNLVIATSSINLGENSAIDTANGAGVLPPGLTINQTVLGNLLRGNTAINAPAVETLVLNASQSVNIFGSVDLDTRAAGASALERLVLGTPAIYGYGAVGDKATVSTGEFVWASVMDGAVAAAPGAAIANRLGKGVLDITADRIVIGHGVNAQPQSSTVADRIVAGFDALNLNASERVLFEGKNRIGVYQAQGSYVADKGFSYSGGALNISAPLITSAAGGSTTVKSGGAIRLVAPEGATTTTGYDALGGELRFAGSEVLVDTTIALHSGKLTLEAIGAIDLGERSRINLSGREIAMFDVKKYSWGGDLSLVSDTGDITQHAGSIIDLSAKNNAGGTLEAVALGTGAGTVDLAGTILGGASGQYDAGGTMVPFDAAELSIEAQHVTDFAGLNARLNTGGVTGARRFRIKQGNLVVGDGVKARRVEIFTDGGSLTVNGLIDASGFQVGSIRLGGRDGLTINGRLDAHGTGVRRDSYGKVIESPNRAIIDLTSSDGRIAIAGGARMDLRYGTDAQTALAPLGTLTFNARRLGANDADISVAGTPGISGAKLIAVNAFRVYDDAPLAANPDVTDSKPQIVTQAYLDAIDLQSNAFINAALGNGDLSSRLSGLGAYSLRPGVEIVSNAVTNPDGNIAIMGDLDLSGYRYGPNSSRSDPTAPRGYGDPGALVIRAGGELSIHGSINDGFGLPVGTIDDNSWLLVGYSGPQGHTTTATPFGQDVVVPIDGVVLDESTRFAAGVILNYDLPAQAMTLPAGTVLPAAATLTAGASLPAGTVLAADILNADDSVAYSAGTVLAQGIALAAGMKLGAGIRLTADMRVGAMDWPKGVPLPVMMSLSRQLPLAVGSLIPSMTDVKVVGGSAPLRPTVNGRQGRNWAVAPMLGEGSTSWDMRLVAGADLDAVDTRMVHRGASGNLTFADTHVGGTMAQTPGGWIWGPNPYFDAGSPLSPIYLGRTDYYCGQMGWCYLAEGSTVFKPERPLLSVVRTGTGDLDLIAGGNVNVRSPYGIYTAGVNTLLGEGRDEGFNRPRDAAAALGAGGAAFVPALADYRAWYPDHGGNLLVAAGGDVTGDQFSMSSAMVGTGTASHNSAEVGNWLWRQGSGSVLSRADSIATAWWFNFGTYALAGNYGDTPSLIGFAGFGALGGGNVDLRVGGDAGIVDAKGAAMFPSASNFGRSQGVVVAIGSTGRMIDNGDGITDAGDLVLTGGGDLNIRLGGAWNPNIAATNNYPRSGGAYGSVSDQLLDLNGALTNLRGNVRLDSRAIGAIGLGYDVTQASLILDPFTPQNGSGRGGFMLTLGDAASYLNSRGDLVLGGAEDPGRVTQYSSSAFRYGGNSYATGGGSWFTLWTDHSAINLFAAGGNLTPSTQIRNLEQNDGLSFAQFIPDGRFIYPSILRAVAPSGSFYYGFNGAGQASDLVNLKYSLLLAPSAAGQLEFLAGQSIYAGNYSVNISGSDTPLPTPFNPAFMGWGPRAASGDMAPVGNAYYIFAAAAAGSDKGVGVQYKSQFPLFAFGPSTVRDGVIGGARAPSRFYAVDGDIAKLRTGERLDFGLTGVVWYEAGGPVHIRAGRDILVAGMAPGERGNLAFNLTQSATTTGNLILHGDPNDVSVISAGRDIRYANFQIAGPGALEISAGRNIVQEDRGLITSLGPVARGDQRPGASISLTAGVGANGLNYTAIRDAYLDPAKLADPEFPLVHPNNQGKVVKVYTKELADWLDERYGFTGTGEEALAYFDGLPAENRNLFLRQVYFAELREGGREYNNADSSRFGSYLRGRAMIATLFPEKDATGKEIIRTGDITLFGGSGVRTIAGGDISLLAPGGQIVVGVQGAVPPSSAGLITQGNGDISTYSEGSLLLGLSRIMTTFGGSILGWSAEGDINAGRGARTTIVFTPPRRVYDSYGNVTLSPLAPSSGAGIATLDPIPEIKPGDIDLIAPLGTIDAGEAGIRVSGNINLAALQVLNAANIQVKGEATGVPQAVVVNTGALTSASSATSAVANQAAQLAERARPQVRTEVPLIINIRFLGFGESPN